MRRLFLLTVLTIGLGAPAWAGFQSGLDVSNRGDYATAVREWKPLAKERRLAELAKPIQEKAMRMSPHDLAMGFLSAAEILSGTPGTLYEALKGMQERGSGLPDFTFTHTFHYPDGITETVQLKTFEELEQFVTNARRLHGAYKEAIMQRGFKQLAPSYDATVSPGCSDRWFSSGEVAVKQFGLVFEASQTDKAFLGAVVEDTVTVIFPGGFELPMTGQYGKSINLRDANSECKITLVAQLGGDSDVAGWVEQALRMPPHDLALAFLGTNESATVVRNLHSYLVERGVSGQMPITIFHPDGTMEQVVLRTLKDVTQFLPKIRLQLDTYKKTIMRRGFKPLALSYDAKVSPSCLDVWFASGEVEAQQNKFNFKLSQAGSTYPGVAVEDTITVILRSGVHDPVLLGKTGNTIEFVEISKGTESNCKIILTPK